MSLANSFCRSAARTETLEPRQLLALTVAATLDGLAREISMSDNAVYFGEDPELNSVQDYTAIKRYSLRQRSISTILPQKGKSWNVDDLTGIRAGGSRAWMSFESPAQLWTITDSETRATNVFSLADYEIDGDDPLNFAITRDGKRAFFVLSKEGTSQLWTSDGTIKGTTRVGTLTSTKTIEFWLVGNGVLFSHKASGDADVEIHYAALGDLSRTRKLKIDTGNYWPLGEQYVAPLPDGNVVIAGNAPSVWNADFSRSRGIVLPAAASGQSNVEQVAPITGGIALLGNSATGGNKELWVAKVDGSGARSVGKTSIYGGYGATKSQKFLPTGSFFSIYYDGGYISTSGWGIGDPVPPDDVLSETGLFTLSYQKGLVSAGNGSIDKTVQLTNGTLLGFRNSAGGDLTDLTAGASVGFDVGAIFPSTNGRVVAFADGTAGHRLMLLDGRPSGGILKGRVEFRDAADNYTQSSKMTGPRPVIYIDSNRDGQRQSGEMSALVDSDNKYLFTSVPTGEKLSIRLDGDASIYDLKTATINSAKLVEGDSEDRDFEVAFHPASIQFFAFDDANGNARYDDGEAGVPGVQFIQDENADGEADYFRDMPLRTTRDNGKVTYTAKSLKEHRVAARVPGGYFATTSSVIEFNPRAGESKKFAVGLLRDRKNAVIRTTVFKDRNANERIDARESGIGGLKVRLYDESGKRVTTRTTNDQGKVAFDGLPFGYYDIVVAGEEGWMDGSMWTSVTLRPGESKSRNVPIQTRPVISGIAFRDTNGNRKRDAGEAPVANAYVALDEYDEFGAYSQYELSPRRTVLTDAQGRYEITLPKHDDRSEKMYLYAFATDATYKIRSTAIDTTIGDQAGVDIALTPDKANGSLSLRAFLDTDGDGVRDAGEAYDAKLFESTSVSVTLSRDNGDYHIIDTDWEASAVVGIELGAWEFSYYVSTNDLEVTTKKLNRVESITIIAGKCMRIDIGLKPRA